MAVTWIQSLQALIALSRYHADDNTTNRAQLAAKKFYLLAKAWLEDAITDGRGSEAARFLHTGSDVLMDRDRNLLTPHDWVGNCWKPNTASATTAARDLLRTAVMREETWSSEPATITITWLHGPSACDYGPELSNAVAAALHQPALALLWDTQADFTTHDKLSSLTFMAPDELAAIYAAMHV